MPFEQAQQAVFGTEVSGPDGDEGVACLQAGQQVFEQTAVVLREQAVEQLIEASGGAGGGRFVAPGSARWIVPQR